METILDVAQLVLGLAAIVLLALKHGPSKRSLRLNELAMMAVDYAEQMGGTKQQKLAHAIGAAQRLDLKDGKRDFSDAEIRIAIEATIARRKV